MRARLAIRRAWLDHDDAIRKAVAELLAPMLKKTLSVAINRVAAPANAIEPSVAEHLADVNTLEAEEPSHRRGAAYKVGAAHFRAQKWEPRKGRINVSLRASISRYTLLMPVLPCSSDRAQQTQPVPIADWRSWPTRG